MVRETVASKRTASPRAGGDLRRAGGALALNRPGAPAFAGEQAEVAEELA